MRLKFQSPIVRKETFRSGRLPDGFMPIDHVRDIFGGNANQYLLDFLQIPELNAVLNIRARAMASGKTDAISKVSGSPANANQSLVRVLRNPNWFQGSKEFWRQSSLFRDIFGNEFIYFLTPLGMPLSFKGMFTLNPARVTIRYKTDGLYFMNESDEGVEYIYTFNGVEHKLDKENLIHLNDNRVRVDKLLEGTSKIESLQPAIKNIREAYQKRNIGLHMPIGIISNDASDNALGVTTPMDAEEKDRVQERLRVRGAVPIMTSMAVKFDGMEISSQKLGLFEEVREDTGRICDAFGVPYEVLANQKGSTYANLKEGKKQMYEEGVIPDVHEKDSAINNHIGTESKTWEIKTDFSHLPVFSEDIRQRAISVKQMVEALSKALADEVITTDEYRAELTKLGI